MGSSSAIPTSQSFTSAHAIQMHGHTFLVDCGEGTQIRLRKFKIPFHKINHIFISHLHGDHFFGLFGLLTTLNLLNRKAPLHLYAFPEMEQILQLNNPTLLFGDHFSYKIVLHPLQHSKQEILYESKNIRISSFPLKHRIPCCGFIFEEKPKARNIRKDKIVELGIPITHMHLIKQGCDFTTDNGKVIPNSELTTPPPPVRKLAICADTMFTRSVIPFIENANVLIHEATFLHSLLKRARETGHSTAQQAGIIANEAQVKKLIINHYSARYKNSDELLAEAKSQFPNTEAAYDGKVIPIEY